MARDELETDVQEHIAARAVRMRGDRLRQLRAARGLTRERLAELSKGPDAISIATIKRAERGNAVYPSSAAALARLLEAPLEDVLADRMAAAGPGTGSSRQATVAVLPLAVLDESERTRMFADGLAEDLTHRLASRWFPVIARCSSFSFREAPLEGAEVGKELGAHYLVEGTLRMERDQIRLTARLVEVKTGLLVWSSSYDERLSDIVALQDRLSAEIVSQVGGSVLRHEVARTGQLAARDLNAWECALQGLWHFHRSTPDDNRRARFWSSEALRRDAGLVMSRYLLVISHQYDLVQQWSRDPAKSRREMRALAREFEVRAPGDPWMYIATAYACVAHGERDEALARLEEALDLAPNVFEAHSLYGQALAMAGQPEQGLHELDLARRLSPRDPKLWTVLLATALSHFVAERYGDAVQWAELAIRNRPHIAYSYATLAAAHALLGDLASARTALRQASERQASMGMRGFLPSFAATRGEIAERFAAGLRLAGLTEGH